MFTTTENSHVNNRLKLQKLNVTLMNNGKLPHSYRKISVPSNCELFRQHRQQNCIAWLLKFTTRIKFEGPREILRKKISIFWILWLLVFQLYSNVYCNRKSLSDNIRQRNIMKPSILEKIACQQLFTPEYQMTRSHDWVTWPNSSKNSLDFFFRDDFFSFGYFI